MYVNGGPGADGDCTQQPKGSTVGIVGRSFTSSSFAEIQSVFVSAL